MTLSPVTARFTLRNLAVALAWWALIPAVAAAGYWLTAHYPQTAPWWGDRAILEWAAAHRAPALDAFFAAVTWLGSLYVLAPLALLVLVALLWRGRGCDGLLLALGLGVAALLSSTLKEWVARARPDLFAPLVPMPGDGAFPSGHMTQAAAFALAFFLLGRRREWRGLPALAVALLLIALAVAVSRVYLQVHYPTDVVAGLLLGLAWVLGLEQLTPGIAGAGRRHLPDAPEAPELATPKDSLPDITRT
ncbi:MAG: phosphatase PAP2 family protein [Gammaproteobacteria bacterium]|nr:phosphatase PAP2 family protein [Gammaproteobacteria bacterium]